MGVPGPVRVRSSFSSRVSTAASEGCPEGPAGGRPLQEIQLVEPFRADLFGVSLWNLVHGWELVPPVIGTHGVDDHPAVGDIAQVALRRVEHGVDVAGPAAVDDVCLSSGV